MENYKEKCEQYLERAKKEIKECGDNQGRINMIKRIFPELRESEDEKIIRTLKEIVNWGCAKNISVENNVELKDCIAWLEKQRKNKDQNTKIYIQKFNIGDTVCRQGYEDDTIEKIYNDGKFEPVYICKNEEGLESHISFSEQDEWKLKDENKYDKGYKDGFSAANFNQCEQKPKEKTKFYDSMDDLTADTLIKEIEGSELDDREKHNFIYWIKSHMQNHSWSEEDELNLNSFLHKLEVCDLLSNKEITWLKNKLKSINPNHWKPSEEQINELITAMNNATSPEGAGILESLYNEIIKL